MMRVKKSEALFLVDLVRSGLRGEAPSGVPSRIDWNRLFDLAAWNSVTGLTWRSVRLVEEVPDDAREKWENSARVTALRKTLYDVEREQVIAELTRRGVSVMPVKGAVIADLYPDAGMRSMAD
ncbi:TPA: nucleotidyltransferase family protein, partial [Clostridioides difficile]|nr:nucleotidyltransferase family protein [Clostridioides difficile]